MSTRQWPYRFYLLALVVLVSTDFVKAQESKTAAFLDGTLGVTVGDGFYTINIGGPSFSLVLDNGMKIGVGALPSLHFEGGKVTPKLGLGPRGEFNEV